MGKKILVRHESEKEDFETLTFANHPKPNIPIVEIEGKKYRDLTDVFTSSEWEGGRYEVQSLQKGH